MAVINEEELKKEIAEKLDLSGYSSEEQEKIISMLLENVSAKLNIAILDRLSEEERAELEKFSDAGKNEEAMNFLSLKISDLQEVIDGTAAKIVEEFKKSRKKP